MAKKIIGTSGEFPKGEDMLELPEGIIIKVLSYLPPDELLTTICLVCHQFHRLVNENTIWRLKCQNERIITTTSTSSNTGEYIRLYLSAKYGHNLIRNSCALEQFKHWKIESNDGDKFAVEEFPCGADPVPVDKENTGPAKNWVTSYGECRKSQLIDLYSVIPKVIVIRFKPVIVVSEWYTRRFDCGSKYKLNVKLLNKSQKILNQFEHEDTLSSGHEWKQVKQKMLCKKAGLRFVLFTHAGQDTQFWAGHYGVKITHSNAHLQF